MNKYYVNITYDNKSEQSKIFSSFEEAHLFLLKHIYNEYDQASIKDLEQDKYILVMRTTI